MATGGDFYLAIDKEAVEVPLTTPQALAMASSRCLCTVGRNSRVVTGGCGASRQRNQAS
jgi:hypothetical protein